MNYQEEKNGTHDGTHDEWKIAILKLIQANPKISRKEMAEHIGKSPRTVSRILSQMDHVHYVGSGNNGHWELD